MEKSSQKGILFALIVLIGNGIHPILNSWRPTELDSLGFTFLFSIFELLCAVFYNIYINHKKPENENESLMWLFQKQDADVLIESKYTKKQIWIRLIIIGILFSFSTVMYVQGLTLAGPIMGSIALKVGPIYALFLGYFFLEEKINLKIIAVVLFVFLVIVYVGTEGTFKTGVFSLGFAMLLITSLMWTIGHTMSKQFFRQNLLTPNQMIILRLSFVVIIIFLTILFVNGPIYIISLISNVDFVLFSLVFGAVYYLMIFSWYSSIRKIDLSFASALVNPSPIIATFLAIWINGDKIQSFHIIGLTGIMIGLYILIYLRKSNK